MKNYYITLRNDFHNTTAKVKARENGTPAGIIARVPASAVRRARRTMCGLHLCLCNISLPKGWEWEHDHSLALVAE